MLNSADPASWDLLALQEPWIDTYGNTRGSTYFRVAYPATFYDNPNSTFRSIILINSNLSTDSYETLDVPSNDITAIRIRTEQGYVSIFNIYNDCTHNDTLHTSTLVVLVF